jgi:hypothetical protein
MGRSVGRAGRGIIAAAALWALAGSAVWGWSEPAKGSKERAALMDAIRPVAEWWLGAPVEFAVQTLRVEGNRAFAVLDAQRPGGVPIDMARTPLALRDGWDPRVLDGARIDVLYKKSGGQWVAVLREIGATDAWYSYDPICAEWRSVLGPAVCP